MRVDDYNVPENLFYTREHEWALLEQGLVRVGVTYYAQKLLYEIVFVDAPERGSVVKQMGSLGTVESVKAVSDIYSPVSGQVVEVNEELEISPELVNQDPYGKGWIAIIKPTDLEKELERLMTPKQYAEHIRKLEQK